MNTRDRRRLIATGRRPTRRVGNGPARAQGVQWQNLGAGEVDFIAVWGRLERIILERLCIPADVVRGSHPVIYRYSLKR